MQKNRQLRAEVEAKIQANLARLRESNAPLYEQKLRLEAEARDIMGELTGMVATKSIVYRKEANDEVHADTQLDSKGRGKTAISVRDQSKPNAAHDVRGDKPEVGVTKRKRGRPAKRPNQ
jgi:hypothetical protein